RTTRGESRGAGSHDLDTRGERFEGTNDGFEHACFAWHVAFDHHHVRTTALCLPTAWPPLDAIEARRRCGRDHPIGEHHRSRYVRRCAGGHHRPVRTFGNEHAYGHRYPALAVRPGGAVRPACVERSGRVVTV